MCSCCGVGLTGKKKLPGQVDFHSSAVSHCLVGSCNSSTELEMLADCVRWFLLLILVTNESGASVGK